MITPAEYFHNFKNAFLRYTSENKIFLDRVLERNDLQSLKVFFSEDDDVTSFSRKCAYVNQFHCDESTCARMYRPEKRNTVTAFYVLTLFNKYAGLGFYFYVSTVS
jgi:hypothetical protein